MTELTDKPAEANPDALIKVKLKKPHTHRGVRYDEKAVGKGAEIEVTENQRKWLAKQGVI